MTRNKGAPLSLAVLLAATLLSSAAEQSRAASLGPQDSVWMAGGGRPLGHGPEPMLDGKPIWADNRDHTAIQNLDYQFEHWGAPLGARDAKDYARKARAFIEHPPHGVERVSRPNGDVLIYDRAANILAIVRRDGAPRLFRKPLGGEADWEKAKAEASVGARPAGRYRAP